MSFITKLITSISYQTTTSGKNCNILMLILLENIIKNILKTENQNSSPFVSKRSKLALRNHSQTEYAYHFQEKNHTECKQYHLLYLFSIDSCLQKEYFEQPARETSELQAKPGAYEQKSIKISHEYCQKAHQSVQKHVGSSFLFCSLT